VDNIRHGFNIMTEHGERETYWRNPHTGHECVTNADAANAYQASVEAYKIDPVLADVRYVTKDLNAPVVVSNMGTKPGSKMDRAVEVYLMNDGKSRKEIIQMFCSQLGLSPAGASTYYQTIKSRHQ
jgi:hypothetical protein